MLRRTIYKERGAQSGGKRLANPPSLPQELYLGERTTRIRTSDSNAQVGGGIVDVQPVAWLSAILRRHRWCFVGEAELCTSREH